MKEIKGNDLEQVPGGVRREQGTVNPDYALFYPDSENDTVTRVFPDGRVIQMRGELRADPQAYNGVRWAWTIVGLPDGGVGLSAFPVHVDDVVTQQGPNSLRVQHGDWINHRDGH